MKLSALLIPLLTTAAVSASKYVSEGWSPGQSVGQHRATGSAAKPTAVKAPRPPKPTPTGPKPPFLDQVKSLLDPITWLQSDAAQDVLEKLGVNITEKLQAAVAAEQNLWLKDIPLITDDNYGELIVNETLTAEEEKERLWVAVITVTAGQKEGVSKMLDQVFDETYSATKEAGDLTHVKWGRIDYLNVTAITTRWNVWQAPYLVFITDRGQTLRFMKAKNIRLSSPAMREFLLTDGYKQVPVWESEYGPGGDKEWIMIYFANTLRFFYDYLVILPKWILFIITGAIGTGVMSLMHWGSGDKAKKAATPAPRAPAPVQKEKVVEAKKEGGSNGTATSKKAPSKKKSGKK